MDRDLGEAAPVEPRVTRFPALHLTAEAGTPGEVRHGHPVPATLVHGAVSRVFRVRLSGAGWVMGARSRPDGARAWTGADALRDRVVPTGALPGPLPPDRHSALAARAVRLGWYDRARLTDDLRRMPGETPAGSAVRAREQVR